MSARLNCVEVARSLRRTVDGAFRAGRDQGSRIPLHIKEVTLVARIIDASMATELTSAAPIRGIRSAWFSSFRMIVFPRVAA